MRLDVVPEGRLQVSVIPAVGMPVRAEGHARARVTRSGVETHPVIRVEVGDALLIVRDQLPLSGTRAEETITRVIRNGIRALPSGVVDRTPVPVLEVPVTEVTEMAGTVLVRVCGSGHSHRGRGNDGCRRQHASNLHENSSSL